jgi:predicted phage baseplate assembly protein
VRPEPDQPFLAAYRIGGDLAGNVGAEAIAVAVLREDTGGGTIRRIRNPLPARGAIAPETVAHARLLAPHAFRRVLRRAIIAADYAAIVERDFGATGPRDGADPVPSAFAGRVQRAAAQIVQQPRERAAVTVLIDPRGTEVDDPALRAAVRQHLERYRRIGHAVTVVQAEYVALDLALAVKVADHYERGAVRAALTAALGDGIQPNGGLGYFHPDRRTFGQPVAVSAIVAVARAVAGVAGVEVTRLWRADTPPPLPPAKPLPPDGVLLLDPHQIAQLANDPDYPEHGTLTLALEGGR